MTLSEWRKLHRLSLKEAEKVLGVSYASICNLERGKADPRLSTMDKIEHGTGGVVTRLDWPTRRP